VYIYLLIKLITKNLLLFHTDNEEMRLQVLVYTFGTFLNIYFYSKLDQISAIDFSEQ
jgi:hypothetical protein